MYLSVVKRNNMIHKYPTEKPKTPTVAEPVATYSVLEQQRVFTDEELSHGIPVEESRRRLTKLIYDHFHQQ